MDKMKIFSDNLWKERNGRGVVGFAKEVEKNELLDMIFYNFWISLIC